MNDHNLDDLIIDNLEPKNKKAKGILTIVALLIVVLIVAILMTSVMLDDSDSNAQTATETESEMISPELTLQNAGKVKKPQAEPKLNEIIEEELNKPVVKKKEVTAVVPVNESKTKVESVPEVKHDNVTKIPVTAKAAKNNKVEITHEFEQKSNVSSVPQTSNNSASTKAPVVKPAQATHTTHGIQYYIQVGSYRNAPSAQILRSIRNSGFSHKIFTKNGSKKLLIGPYQSRSAVNTALVRVRDRINKNAFVVKR